MMYRLGQRDKHTRRLLIDGIVLLVFVVVIGGIVAARHYFKPDTALKQSSSVTTHINATDQPATTVSEPTFSFDLPATWKATKAPEINYKIYSWVGTSKIDNARRLDIYVDSVPASLAVNRLLPVQSDGPKLAILNSVSDNCLNFTGYTNATAKPDSVPAKWSGISFLCDLGNYNRDVVGTGSLEGINTVTLIGPQTGHHTYFFAYTDHGSSPNYTVFTDMLHSFQAL